MNHQACGKLLLNSKIKTDVAIRVDQVKRKTSKFAVVITLRKMYIDLT